MAIHVFSKETFYLWCLLGTAFSIPSSRSLPQGRDDRPFTTTRKSKVIIDMDNLPKVKSSWPVENLELLKSTSATSAATTLLPKSTTTPRIINEEQPLYRVNSSNGRACILLQVDAVVDIPYRTKIGQEEVASVYIPPDAEVTGDCNDENTVKMSLRWKTFILSWSFAKTPGRERWYVDKIELTFNTSDRHFEHIDQPNKTIRLSTDKKHTALLFPTPVGKSYSCSQETVIPLTYGKMTAKLLLRAMKLQPFKFKTNDFAAEYNCDTLNARVSKDETAPIAVGSTLAAAVLLTVTGYAGYRYFVVKKVKYDTME